MNKRNVRIIGIIDEFYIIDSIKCQFNDNVNHKVLWNNAYKKWTWNLFNDIDDSELSENYLNYTDKQFIRDHLTKKYKIVYNNGLLDKIKTMEALKCQE